ncbi:hypothetical protein Y032_0058g2910 [Ancylostoma ceylanicum]|uniref:Uncharacterized protein n=1 Tax=Ancylostoma ceylanicum TaxID=53326 RepID=A0A016U3U4_9BILA|nr:hypothetical protein Y032_0058g2910 [Ancylostoma ceylanicum]
MKFNRDATSGSICFEKLFTASLAMFLRLCMPLNTADLAVWISKCDRIYFLDEVLYEAGLRIRCSSPAEAVQRRPKLATDSERPESDIQP